ncbi:hypothetical protein BJX76DRAFT_187879 [Aspergillus varians]
MFHLPIAPPLRIAAHPLTPIILRARTSIPSSQCSRFFSTPRTRIPSTKPLISLTRTFRRPSRYVPPRFFESSSQRYYYNNGFNRYRRFNGSRGSFILRLVRNAKPIHFVVIGGLIGGFYVYNTETVEVRTSFLETSSLFPVRFLPFSAGSDEYGPSLLR